MGTDGNRGSDVAELDLAHQIREYHHRAIWEEEKHFTWLISIVLSAQLLVLTSKEVSDAGKPVIILVASLAGILLAVTGFHVQRKEGFYFHLANVRFTEEYKALYPNTQLPALPQKPNKNIPELLVSVFTGKLGIRDSFQFLLLCFVVIFLALVIYAYVVH